MMMTLAGFLFPHSQTPLAKEAQCAAGFKDSSLSFASFYELPINQAHLPAAHVG